jgi:hypothetical protein
VRDPSKGYRFIDFPVNLMLSFYCLLI